MLASMSEIDPRADDAVGGLERAGAWRSHRVSQSRLNATPTTRWRPSPNVSRIGATSDTLECLATLAGDAGSHREAARLFGAAAAIRQRMGVVRFKVWDAGYEASVAALRNAMGEADFESRMGRGRRPVH